VRVRPVTPRAGAAHCNHFATWTIGGEAVGQQALTFLGVILGASIAGGISLWQVQFVTKREHETRQIEREQTRKDVRDAFQRDTVIATQEAIVEISRCVVRDQDEKLAVWNQDGTWPDRSDSYPLPDDYALAFRTMATKLRPRIFDETLRNLVQQIVDESGAAIFSQDERSVFMHTRTFDDLVGQFNERLIVVLPDLFWATHWPNTSAATVAAACSSRAGTACE
jgi:hypothetical protein